ncbi:DUF6339 family protein [Amycolatopsis anabasis]|uniref:DUF6339 family protein n=1 Tax=Amycolatopsis anabasis TaxID=1840409 RepID=UPI00131B5B63|nr:DUF6339 family protein [Amycolatopsis anabasis]
MSRATTALEIPPVLGLLPDTAVVKYLSHGIQSGKEKPPQVALRKASIPFPEDVARWRAAPIRELVDEAMRRFEDRRTSKARAVADGWLAPRLHATLRLTRAEAADARLWNFMALVVAPDYVVWRHKGGEIATSEHFSGAHYKQAFARLWWTAELFRNGKDYRTVELACRSQDTLNTTLRLDIIDHRPTAMALLRVVEQLLEARVHRPGDHINALSKAVNAAGSTLFYDVLAPDEPPDDDVLHNWIAESADMPPVSWERLPDGPDDGAANEVSVNSLVPFFKKLLDEAPIRHRPRKAVTG